MREDRAFCKHCQYTLAGLTRNVCPECGTMFDLARRHSFSRHPLLRKWGRRITASIFGFSVLYVTTYYCSVQTQQPLAALQQRMALSPRVLVWGSERALTLELQPTYRVGGDLASLLYKPIHSIDRKLRSSSWSVLMKRYDPNSFLWAGM